MELRISFHSFIHSFIYLFIYLTTQQYKQYKIKDTMKAAEF